MHLMESSKQKGVDCVDFPGNTVRNQNFQSGDWKFLYQRALLHKLEISILKSSVKQFLVMKILTLACFSFSKRFFSFVCSQIKGLLIPNKIVNFQFFFGC
jgi:hypothetical protein